MLTRLGELNTDKLTRRLEEVAVESTTSDATVWREALATRVGRRAKRFATAIQAAGQIYAPDRLHNVRVATKKLRYVLEVAGDIGVRQVRPLVTALKRLQETLGRLNDLNVLQRHVAEVQTNPPARRGATAHGLDTISRILEEECRHLHARYTKLVPALLEIAQTCRSVITPLIATAGRRRAPLKMARATQVRQPAARRA